MKKRTKIVIVAGLISFFFLSVAFCFHMYSDTRKIVRNQAIRSITNISQLNEESVTKSIENRKMLLQTIAVRLERRNIEDVDVILRELADFKEIYDFANMGILGKDHTLYMLGGMKRNMEGTDLDQLVWDAQFHITESYSAYDGGKFAVNAFSYPVFSGEEVEYILIGTYYSKNLTERMNLSSMEGKGYNFLLDCTGNVVIYPQYYENEEYNALMQYINDTPEVIPSNSGDQFFTYDGESYYAHFEELGFNNWFLMTCAKESDVFADADHMMNIVFIATGVLWVIILVSISCVFVSMHRNRQKRIRSTFYDELLDIGNENALNVCYKNLPKQELDKMYLIAFDIDKFKEFNYIYGSEDGDRLLQYIVRVVKEEFPKVYLFRYVSDYFVALHPYEDPEVFAEKLQHLDSRVDKDVADGIIQPFEISAGVRQLQEGDSLSLVFSDAMIARETIKGNYLCHFVFYDGTVRERRLMDMEMESRFTGAVQNNEFRVFYQPKYDILTNEIIGAEALVRWVREDGTIISPGMFIPCFEKSSQIIFLDEIILTEVCRQMREMEKDGLEIKPVSVNLSRVHLKHPGILNKIESIVTESGIDPRMLSFEITESALLEESIPMKEILDRLHRLGCRVDIDDYGVGASNPDVLISNDFDMLKMDKFFVDNIGDKRAEDIIRSTAHLAMQWGMEILAEGVEERYQAERLVELGCVNAQGFYYSKPIPEEEYRELLRSAAASEHLPKVPMIARCFSEDVCAVLDGNLLPTYIIDPEHFIVMYCNEALRKYVGEDPTGGLCYQKMRKRNQPCENCSAMRLYRNGDDSPKEIRSEFGAWALIQTSPLHWQGREFIQLTCVDITKQKNLEEELRLYNREYSAVVYQSTSGVMRYDIDTGTAAVNVDMNLNRVEEYTIPDYVNVVRESNIVDPESMPCAKEMLDGILAGTPSKGYDLHLFLPNGEKRWCHLDYTLIPNEKGRFYRAVVSFFDNTEQREKELEYQRWNSRLNALMHEYTAYMEVNLSKDVIEAEGRHGQWEETSGGRCFSEALERMAGMGIFEEDRFNFRKFFHRERLLGQFLAGNMEGTLEYRTMMEGALQWYKAELQMVSDPFSGDVKASIMISNVDTDMREREHLKNVAERDAMTGLYNHAIAETLIRQVLELSTGERVCFLIIDLDDLRDINSTLGHPEGDRALIAIADCMRAQFRKTDILGRIGGDEFVVLLRNSPEISGLRSALSSFMRKLNEIMIGPLNDWSVHASVGGTIGTAGVDDFDTLYRQADLALFYTKAMGKNNFHMYVPELEKREFRYTYRSDASLADGHALDPMEIRKLLQAVSYYCPMVISINLTKKTYYMMEYMDYTTRNSKDEGNLTQLIEDGYNSFHPEDREEFRACFNQKNMMEAYERGERMIQHVGRQIGDDGIYRMMKTVAIFTKDGKTDDICVISFTHEISEEDGKTER